MGVRASLKGLINHPNYHPTGPYRDETCIAFTLRRAAHLLSPPQEPRESEGMKCVDAAQQIRNLHYELQTEWDTAQTEWDTARGATPEYSGETCIVFALRHAARLLAPPGEIECVDAAQQIRNLRAELQAEWDTRGETNE